MPVISASVMNQLENLYGNAYQTYNTALGDSINDRNSVLSYINDAKVVARGGIDKRFGVKGDNSLLISRSAVASGDLTVNDGYAYFDGNIFYIPSTTVSKAIASLSKPGETTLISNLKGLYNTGHSYIVELIVPSTINATPTYNLIVTNTIILPTYTYNDMILGKSYKLTNNFSYNNAFSKTTPGGIPIAYGVNYNGSNAAKTQILNYFYSEDIRPVAYEESLNEDSIIINSFAGLDDTENALLSKNLSSDFRAGLDAIVNNTTTNQPLSFKDYWQSQGYQFTYSFRKLYYKTYSVDLNTKLYSVSPNYLSYAPTYYDFTRVNAPANLQIKAENSLFTGTTQVDIYGMLYPSVSRTFKSIGIKQASLDITTDYNQFATYSYAAIKNADGSYDTIKITPSTSGAFRIFSYVSTYTGIDYKSSIKPAFSEVYPVEKITTFIPSGTPINTVVNVGTTGSKYIAVTYVRIPTYGNNNCRVTVYSK